ncbi:MAG: Glycosyltransferase involved in cell wall biogenesis [Microgenomates group bacterium GW2011_GWF2_47_9]|nr:MAG: Glycosyltransferase involved in cell wall biogenesis [Microgenomates group bacterium GW2011_GWF2_47_9]
MKTMLSAIIVTASRKNAARAIKSCAFADEVVVIEKPSISDYAAARNEGIKKSRGEWVLFVDADETVPPELAKEIAHKITSTIYTSYYLKRLDTFLGRTLYHGENGALKIIRLAKRTAGTFSRPIHEVWQVKGRIGTLHHPLIHYPHPSLAVFLDKINRYSSLEAEYRHSRKIKSSLFHILFFPPAKFIKNYLLLAGFLDGMPGAVMAIMMSLHSFLTWTKLYLLPKGR